MEHLLASLGNSFSLTLFHTQGSFAKDKHKTRTHARLLSGFWPIHQALDSRDAPGKPKLNKSVSLWWDPTVLVLHSPTLPRTLGTGAEGGGLVPFGQEAKILDILKYEYKNLSKSNNNMCSSMPREDNLSLFQSTWRDRDTNGEDTHGRAASSPWTGRDSITLPSTQQWCGYSCVQSNQQSLSSSKPAILIVDVLIFLCLKVCYLLPIVPHSASVTALHLSNERSLGERIKYASNSEELISFLSTHVKPEHPFNVKDHQGINPS